MGWRLRACLCSFFALAGAFAAAAESIEDGLVGRWPFSGETTDISAQKLRTSRHGEILLDATGPSGKPGTAATFNGRDAWLDTPSDQFPKLGAGDFSISVWLNVDERLDDTPGDVISKYDPQARRGFHLALKTNAGVTSSQPNYRHLQFGIDADRATEWTDCGNPGDAVFAFSLAVHEGALYAGTCRPGKDESGRVYRYADGDRWIDCGAPDRSNSVTAMAVYNGGLYAGTGKYRLGGSALPESENPNLGGSVFRYAGEDKWIDCGALPNTEAVGGLVVFQDRLYAGAVGPVRGFMRLFSRESPFS